MQYGNIQLWHADPTSLQENYCIIMFVKLYCHQTLCDYILKYLIKNNFVIILCIKSLTIA